MIRVRHILLYLLSGLLTLLAGEMYLRIAGICEQSDVEYVDGLGKMLRPNHSMVRFSEGFAITSSNGHRHLGPDRPQVRARSSVRIALLGDSFIEGYQVHDRHHLRYVLESELSLKRPSVQIEVLNFGRSNFDLGNMYAYDQGFVQEFSPDITLFFLSLDDLSIEYADPLLPSTRLVNEQLNFSSNSDSAYFHAFQRSSWLLRHSHLFYFLNKARHRLQSVSLWTILTGKGQSHSPQQEDHSSDFSPLTFHILGELSSDHQIVWRDLRPPPAILTDWLTAHNRSFVDLSPFLQQLERDSFSPYYWPATRKEGHWNQQAHQAIGAYLAKELVDHLP